MVFVAQIGIILRDLERGNVTCLGFALSESNFDALAQSARPSAGTEARFQSGCDLSIILVAIHLSIGFPFLNGLLILMLLPKRNPQPPVRYAKIRTVGNHFVADLNGLIKLAVVVISFCL